MHGTVASHGQASNKPEQDKPKQLLSVSSALAASAFDPPSGHSVL